MPNDGIPDARDGLTRVERLVLVVLHDLRTELASHNVPLPMLYGRVLLRVDLSRPEFERVLRRLMQRS
jgi:hypothetical protein